MDGGAGASAIPVYNKFVELAKAMRPEYISMIMPSRWFSGGRGLDNFRANMLADKRMALLYDFIDAHTVFSDVEIKGGICFFLWNSKWNKKCTINTYTPDLEKPILEKRYLQEVGDSIFIRDPRLLRIKESVTKNRLKYGEPTFDTIVSSMRPYGLRGDFFKNPSKYKLPNVENKQVTNGITILGLNENLRRTKKYVPLNYPLPIRTGIETYKIFIPRNWGTGKLQDCYYKTYLAEPNEVCTETFIQVYPFENKEERDNCNKYMQTKFFRIIICIKKQDQSAGKDVYSFVPLPDFTTKSEIKWSLPIADLDIILYKRYGILPDEIQFIEKNIKGME